MGAYVTAISEASRETLLTECLRQQQRALKAEERAEAMRMTLECIAGMEGVEGIDDHTFAKRSLSLVGLILRETR